MMDTNDSHAEQKMNNRVKHRENAKRHEKETDERGISGARQYVGLVRKMYGKVKRKKK